MRGIDRIIAGYAGDIIKAVARERMVGVADLKTGNASEYVKARKAAIRRLRSEGFSLPQISKYMEVSEKTAWLHMSDRARLKDNARRLAYYARATA